MATYGDTNDVGLSRNLSWQKSNDRKNVSHKPFIKCWGRDVHSSY